LGTNTFAALYNSVQMKISGFTTLILLISIIGSMKGQMDTTSYSIGVSVAQRLAKQGVDDVDYASFIKGFEDALEKADLILPQAEIDRINFEFYQEKKKRMTEKIEEEGKAFLADNAKRPEVRTTTSGLQYEILRPTSGAKPAAQNEVTVHYEGKLLDGTKFDSSIDRGEPASFPLTRVIKGWTEGVQLMTVGSKYRFYIPHDLAYGARGAGASVPPYSTLIFDIELISIK